MGHFFISKIEKRQEIWLWNFRTKIWPNWTKIGVHPVLYICWLKPFSVCFIGLHFIKKKNKFDKIIKKVKSFVTGILSLMSQLQQNFRYFFIKFSWHHNPLTTWTCLWSNKLRSRPHLTLWDRSFQVIEAIVHIFTHFDRFSSNFLKFPTLHVTHRHYRHSLL